MGGRLERIPVRLNHFNVIAGLDPAIQGNPPDLRTFSLHKTELAVASLDCRVKPGNDNKGGDSISSERALVAVGSSREDQCAAPPPVLRAGLRRKKVAIAARARLAPISPKLSENPMMSAWEWIVRPMATSA